MKTSIALIGFMGVGKSSVGKKLAQRLGKRYVETDALIEQRAGKTISQLFHEDGEVTFREMEIEVIKELASQEGQVIDCGGGVVLNKINIDRLKQKVIVVWLTASPQTIAERILAAGEGRPLLAQDKEIPDIRSLMRLRKPYYEQAAEIKVDTSKMNLESVVSKTIERLKKHADYH